MAETDRERPRGTETERERPPVAENDEQAGLHREMRVRDEDLEPHAGLRYIARLFKVLALLLVLLLIAEIVIGLVREGTTAIPTLLVEATRLVVFAGFLWGIGDLALMLIESNHDLRATRILVGRLNSRVQRVMGHFDVADEEPAERTQPAPPPPGVQRRDPDGREL